MFIINNSDPIQKIIYDLLNNINIIDINKGIDTKVYNINYTIIFSSTENQKNQKKENNITIDFGECEYILKDYYNISYNDSLYIIQIIYDEEGMKISKVYYEVYYPLFNIKNLTKLNLTLCKDTKVELYIKVKINDTLDKYNASSGYYNDICYKAESEYGTDITLKDRRIEFINNNMSLCEENCDLVEYNYSIAIAKCSCNIKTEISSNYDNIKFNKNEFFKNFIEINNYSNIWVMKCYYVVLKIKNLIKNYGFYILTLILIIYLITLLIFFISSYEKLIIDIHKLVGALNFSELSNNKKDYVNSPTKRKSKFRRNSKRISVKTVFKRQDKKFKIEEFHSDLLKYNAIIMNNSNSNFNMKKIENNNNDLLGTKDYELNSLDYEDALKLDHRNFIQYYLISLKCNHPIMFSFNSFNDYNSGIIKIFLFFFAFGFDLTINALFFVMIQCM